MYVCPKERGGPCPPSLCRPSPSPVPNVAPAREVVLEQFLHDCILQRGTTLPPPLPLLVSPPCQGQQAVAVKGVTTGVSEEGGEEGRVEEGKTLRNSKWLWSQPVRQEN